MNSVLLTIIGHIYLSTLLMLSLMRTISHTALSPEYGKSYPLIDIDCSFRIFVCSLLDC